MKATTKTVLRLLSDAGWEAEEKPVTNPGSIGDAHLSALCSKGNHRCMVGRRTVRFYIQPEGKYNMQGPSTRLKAYNISGIKSRLKGVRAS